MIVPKKKEELKERYGVIKEIPVQKVEEEKKVLQEKKQTEINNIDLLLRVEKLEGKFSAFEDIKDDINERISRISEEIGELRSSFLELDKRFSSLEAKIEKTIDAVEQIQPEKFSKELQKKEAEITRLQADLEALKSLVAVLKRDNQSLRIVLEKIKSLDNLISMYNKLHEKIQMIDDTKLYVDRLAGKVETIFAELESKMKDVENVKSKIQKLDDMTIDIVKMLDGISIKVTKMIEKDAAQKLLEEMVKKNVQELNKNYLNELKTFIEQTKLEAKKDVESEKQKLMNVISEVASLTNSLKASIPSGLESYNYQIKFLRLINMLNLSFDREEILQTINQIDLLRSKMIQKNAWDGEMESLLKKTFEWLTNVWDYYQNEEIKQIFEKKLAALSGQNVFDGKGSIVNA